MVNRRESIARVAKERIDILKKFALDNLVIKPDIAENAYRIARAISMRARVRMPVELKRYFCRRCGAALTSNNIRVRVRDRRTTHVVVTCLRCGFVRRYVALEKTR